MHSILPQFIWWISPPYQLSVWLVVQLKSFLFCIFQWQILSRSCSWGLKVIFSSCRRKWRSFKVHASHRQKEVQIVFRCLASMICPKNSKKKQYYVGKRSIPRYVVYAQEVCFSLYSYTYWQHSNVFRRWSGPIPAMLPLSLYQGRPKRLQLGCLLGELVSSGRHGYPLCKDSYGLFSSIDLRNAQEL